jgi:hypothetical protein
MKLHELDTLKQQDKAERVLETRLGQTVSFGNLSLRESRHMLMRVRGLINEHRSSAASHSSERDPAYLKLLMLESGLKGRLKEVAPIVPGQPGAAGAVPVDTKDPKVQAAMKKSQSGQNLSPDEQKLVGAVAASTMQKESRRGRRRLGESEIQQAQVVLAAQDMVDQMQKVIEQISAMQFKDLPALADSIKNDPNMGQEQATAYQSAATAALTQLLQSVQQGKTALEGAQGTLTGQAPVVPGEGPAANMAAPPEGDLGGDELNPDADMDVPPEGGDEATDELGNATSLGRERRGVAEAKEGKLPSMAHIKKMCQDGKTVAEICKMHPDCDRTELKQMIADCKKKLQEGARPDFLDIDKDGNKKEKMKDAAADKKAAPKKGVNPFAKKK